MNKILCNSCYSSDSIIYAHQAFICSKCKIILKRCNICDLYCNDQCMNIFTNVLKISDAS